MKAQYRTTVEFNGRTNVVVREWGSGESWTPIAPCSQHQDFSLPRKIDWEKNFSQLLSQSSAGLVAPVEYKRPEISADALADWLSTMDKEAQCTGAI
jgi:hypothetical protein